MRNLKVILMAALLLTFFSGKVFAVDFDQAFKSLTNASTVVDNALGKAGSMVGGALNFSTSVIGMGSVVNMQSVKAMLPTTLFNGPCTAILRDSAARGAGVADWARTGISGLGQIAVDFKKSDFGARLMGPSPLATTSSLAPRGLAAKKLGASAYATKIPSAKSIEGLGKVTKSNLKGLDAPLTFNKLY